jgi:uncharacterized protein (DUF1499 family)
MFSKRIRRTLGVALIIVAIPFVSLQLMSNMSKRPGNLGAQDGQLAACPDSPNCVSSQATDPQHAIEAIRFDGPADAAMATLRRVVERDRGATVVSMDERSLSAEYRSRIFRFVDDVDFVLNETEGVIDFRSASRVGYSDMGANRRRMERIRTAFEAEQDAAARKE